MKKTLNLVEATSSFIINMDQPVITDYQIGTFIFHAYLSKTFHGHPLRLKKDHPQIKDYNRLIEALTDKNIIKPSKKFSHRSVFDIQNKPPAHIAELVCLLDPFAYISHLSAMNYYQLSDKKEKKLFISSYPLNLWKTHAYDFMRKNLKEGFKSYKDNRLPHLRKLETKKKDGVEIVQYNSKDIGSFKYFRKNKIRVSTIERTFLDMLRMPELCGGMGYVQKVYKEHSLRYLTPVLKEIDEFGSQIEKVRAGYLLEEVCKITDPFIEKWLNFVQRGG